MGLQGPDAMENVKYVGLQGSGALEHPPNHVKYMAVQGPEVLKLEKYMPEAVEHVKYMGS